MATDNLSKFKQILREMFQFDQADLDFGIYRIMNQKRAEVEKFLEEELLPQVKEAFSVYASTDKAQVVREMEELKQILENAGVVAEEAPKYQKLQSRLESATDLEALEQDVFSHLVTFFSRYYDNGDFISRRRYKAGVYALPYSGEEVKLHWANADQYYIKTTEFFRDYTFNLPSGKKVHFKIIAASTEQDNNKEQNGKERCFFLDEELPLTVEDRELYIRFQYNIREEKQEELNTQTVRYLKENATREPLKDFTELFTLSPTESNPNRMLLEKHLRDYTARNTFDYFIHKDLGGFLRRELDFYLKNEVMHIDDLDTENELRIEQYLSKIKVIKRIAHKIIVFLEQLENFQKKLWLKKKFVVETNYCLTLDKVPEELYPRILTNEEQIQEWKDLFAIEEIERSVVNPGYSEPLTVEFLKANPYLVLDTAFFDEDFKEKLLASFDDLEESLDGLLVHSENFQALNLLQERYKEQVKCIYIDPPYNTGTDEFIYKDNYQHSSWLSMKLNRAMLCKSLLSISGTYFQNIGEELLSQNILMCQDIFNKNNMIGVISRVQKTASNKGTFFAPTIDYILCFAKDKLGLDKFSVDVNKKLYKKIEQDGPYKGQYYRDDVALYQASLAPRPNQRYYIECPDGSKVITPEGGMWRWTEDTMKRNYDRLVFKLTDRSPLIDEKGEKAKYNIYTKSYLSEREESGTLPRNLIENCINRKGADLLKKMDIQFEYSKPVELVLHLLKITKTNLKDIILDFFAGSGTTAHAVINLNREDGGQRRYILVEMGDYFDTVMKPRIQKVIYSHDWKDGKPVSREGSSHMFKYLRLESYEDTLSNLEMKRTGIQQQTLDKHPQFREEYMLSYMLDVESRESASLLNLDQFEDPFNYKLQVYKNGETRPVTVDLVETFNYLLGLRVRQTEMIRGFKVVRGDLPDGEKALIIWRNLKEKSREDLSQFVAKQDYSTLDFEFDRIYVNGDHNLQSLKRSEDRWKVLLIEQEFKRLMFDLRDV